MIEWLDDETQDGVWRSNQLDWSCLCSKIFEVALADSIADPIEARVDGFGPFLFDGVGGDAAGGIIVGGHRGGRLWVAHFFEGNLQRTGFFSIME